MDASANHVVIVGGPEATDGLLAIVLSRALGLLDAALKELEELLGPA